MDFTVTEELEALSIRIGEFVREEIIPLEGDDRWTAHGPTSSLREEMNDRARNAGLFAPQGSREFGGMGLTHMQRAFAFEAAGYSVLGPTALHCAAPDEGNMHMLDEVASPDQRQRYLKPLVEGARSCFCMTEPGGAGADPRLLATTAREEDGRFIISGRKWLITGAEGASICIIMARMEGGEMDGRATMFLSAMNRPEIVIERQMDTLDSSFPGGHCVVRFDNLEIAPEDVLGEVGRGFEYAQVRLAPARLTHCMRWLGAARRAHDVARNYASSRQAFGQTLGRHEGVGFMLADNQMDMHVSRLAIRDCAWKLDQGMDVAEESSMSKVICSEAIWRTVDRSVQILGGMGITRETPVERIFREVRGFRIYDGPSEVHRWSLARRCLKQADPAAAPGQIAEAAE